MIIYKDLKPINVWADKDFKQRNWGRRGLHRTGSLRF